MFDEGRGARDEEVLALRAQRDWWMADHNKQVDLWIDAAQFANLLKEEVACLRSVLSEWEQDKSCFVQWQRAEEIRAIKNVALKNTPRGDG